VIGRFELIMLLNGRDSEATANSLATLLAGGLMEPLLDGDSVIGFRTTQDGDNRLSSMTLPATTA
jgi:hypothetical protein